MTIPLIPILTILFVVLKVTGVIAWSWLWVFSPLWIGIPIVILFYVLFFGAFATLFVWAHK